jgi:hypothetical protein
VNHARPARRSSSRARRFHLIASNDMAEDMKAALAHRRRILTGMAKPISKLVSMLTPKRPWLHRHDQVKNRLGL